MSTNTARKGQGTRPTKITLSQKKHGIIAETLHLIFRAGVDGLAALDLDGTLVDSFPNFHTAFCEVISAHSDGAGVFPSIADLSHGVSVRGDWFHRRGVSRHFTEDYLWGKIRERVLQMEENRPIQLYDGVADALRQLSQHRQLVVVTLNRVHPVREILERQTGLDDILSIVVNSSADKAKVLKTLAKYHYRQFSNGRPNPFCFFGDTVDDMRAGKGGGIFPIGVLHASFAGDQRLRESVSNQLLRAGANKVIEPHEIARAAFECEFG